MSELPASPLLILSPHLDDVALSCSALVDRDEPAEIVTVFAGSPDPPRVGRWDQSLGFRDSTQALAARRAEEAAAFAGSPHDLRLLDLVDEQYLDGPRPNEDAEAIRAVVREFADRNDGGLVALPAAAGRREPGRWGGRLDRLLGLHTRMRQSGDHRFVRDAGVTAVAGDPRLTAVLYEELPYAWGQPANRAVAVLSRSRGLRAVALSLPVDRRRKAARIRHYTSQVSALTSGRRLDVDYELPPVERYWLLEPRGHVRSRFGSPRGEPARRRRTGARRQGHEAAPRERG